MWLQIMECLLILLRFFTNFAQNWRKFMTEVLYLHQTFINFYLMWMITFFYNKISDVTASNGTLLDFIEFFWVFSYITNNHSCLKHCIITKLSRIVCLINTYILIYWHARCSHKLRKALWFNWFFRNFNVWYVILHQTFINFVKSLWK